ncbi:hypothetical protein HDU76_012191, partial [Blyttiomyces sp. JEL0837]
MSGCSIYDGSLCFCTDTLSGGTTVDVGFGSDQQGYCGDCNTALSCGGAGAGIPNLSQFAGKTCGLKYIVDVEKGNDPQTSNTTVKNAVFFYPVSSVSTTSNIISSTSSSTGPSRTTEVGSTTPPTGTTASGASSRPIIAGVVGGLVVVLIVAGIFVVYAYRRRRKDGGSDNEKAKAIANSPFDPSKPDA